MSNRLLMANRDIRQIYDKQWTVTVVDEVLKLFFYKKKNNIRDGGSAALKLLAPATLLIDTLYTIQTILYCSNIPCVPIYIVWKVRTLLEWVVGLLSKILGDGYPKTFTTTRAPTLPKEQINK